MNPIDFPQAMRSLAAPKDAPNVTPLRIWTDGQQVLSFWLPSENEKLLIAAGAPIVLRLLSGSTMHPACIEVGSPFEGSETLGDADRSILQQIGITFDPRKEIE